MKVLFLMPVATQARFRRRIVGLQAAGAGLSSAVAFLGEEMADDVGWIPVTVGVVAASLLLGRGAVISLSLPVEILALMGRVGEVQWESVFGTTFPAYYALFAQRHMHEFGTTRKHLLEVATIFCLAYFQVIVAQALDHTEMLTGQFDALCSCYLLHLPHASTILQLLTMSVGLAVDIRIDAFVEHPYNQFF